MKAMIYATKKRDDDAQVVQQGDDVFISTTERLPGVSYSPLPELVVELDSSSMMEEAASAPRRDIRVQIIYNMFLANGLACMCVLLLSMPFFFWPFVTRQVAITVMCISCVLFAIAYALSIFVRKRPSLALCCLSSMGISLTCIVGTAANLSANVAPIQLIVMLFVQSMSVVAYARLSPQFISTVTAMVYMTISSLVVWAISIAVFVVERDWLAGTVILIISTMCIAYHGLEIRLTEARYNLSWDDTILSMVQFYADPILLLVSMAQTN